MVERAETAALTVQCPPTVELMEACQPMAAVIVGAKREVAVRRRFLGRGC
jgi:hypothetical protein